MWGQTGAFPLGSLLDHVAHLLADALEGVPYGGQGHRIYLANSHCHSPAGKDVLYNGRIRLEVQWLRTQDRPENSVSARVPESQKEAGWPVRRLFGKKAFVKASNFHATGTLIPCCLVGLQAHTISSR